MPSSAPLRMTRSRAFRAASRARAAVRHFSMIRRPSAGFSSRNWPRLSATAVWTWPFSSALLSLALVWLANVLAGEIRVGVAKHPGAARPVIERARQRGPEPGDVGPAIDRVDVVRER